MRVLTRCSHDDHDLGSVYELEEGEKLERLLTAGVVLPADAWTYRHQWPANGDGDQQHIFTAVAPAPAHQDPGAPASTIAVATSAAAPEPLVTRAEG